MPPTISEVLSAVDSLRNDLNKRLDEIEKHLSAIDDCVNKLSNRISAIDDIEKVLRPSMNKCRISLNVFRLLN